MVELRFTVVRQLIAEHSPWVEMPVYFTDIQECLAEALKTKGRGFNVAILIEDSDPSDTKEGEDAKAAKGL